MLAPHPKRKCRVAVAEKPEVVIAHAAADDRDPVVSAMA